MNATSCFRALPLLLAPLPGLAAALPAQQQGDTIRLRPIVVTATRLPTPRDEVVSGVTVFTGEELRAQGITHVLEALRTVPSAAVVQTGSFGGVTSLFLRGGQSNYVRVLVDGVPVNQPGGTFNLANLSTDNVERIEIVRGPASVLYGSDAVTGVVQVFTRRGAGAPRFAVSARGGTFGSTAFTGGVLGGTGPVSYSLAGSRFGSDGSYAFNNEYRNATLSGLLRLAPDARSDAQISVRYNDNTFHFPTDGLGNLADSNQYTAGRSTAVGIEVGRFVTDALEGRLLLASHEEKDRSENLPDYATDPNASHGRTDLQRRSADLRANVHLRAGAIVTAGMVVERERAHAVTTYQSSFGPGDDSVDVDRTNRALYAQAVLGWRERLSANAGIRFERNEAFGRFTTLRAGAAYRLNRSWRLRTAAGTAFKEPTICENYGGCFANGNPGLRPERTRSWEVGLGWADGGGRVEVAGTYFDQRFRDMIQYTYATARVTDPNFYNVAGAEASGVEFEAQLAAGSGLSLSGSYTFLRTAAADSSLDQVSFVPGGRLLRRPTHSGSLGLSYRLRAPGTVTLRALYVGRRTDIATDPATFASSRVVLPAHWRVDAGGELELTRALARRGGLTLTLSVENLLDAKYDEVLRFPARRRTLFAGLRLGLGT